MKPIIFSVLLATLFSAVLFANEELGNSSRLFEDMEVRMKRAREAYEQAERWRARRLDGREVVVRVYSNWQEDRVEFEKIYIQLDGDMVILDFIDISESAFVVVVGEDQDDEVVRKSLGYYIYAEPYKEGLKFKLPHSGSYRYELAIKDSVGNPLSRTNVQIFIYAKEFGKESRILVREVELDESGVFKSPSINGSLRRLYLMISHPDNHGMVVVDLEEMGFYREIVIDREDTVRVPWVPKENEAYERSIRGVVVDDANNPISGAMVTCNLVYPPGAERSEPLHDSINKVLTDEQGQFCLYRSIRGSDDETHKLVPKKSKYYVSIEAPKELGIMPFRGYVVNDAEHVIKMDEYGYFRTFVFEDKDGPIVDPNKLKGINLIIYPKGKPVLVYSYHGFKEGGYFPLGTYKASLWQEQEYEFEPLKVTKESPEELVFEFGDYVHYAGRVVNGITGKPMKSAFVIGVDINFMGGVNLSCITPEQWNRLHELGSEISVDSEVLDEMLTPTGFENGLLLYPDEKDYSDEYVALKPIGGFYGFEKVVRTDADGRFEIHYKTGRKVSSFMAIEEGYLPVELNTWYFSFDQNNRMELPPMPLFPAATVMVDISFEQENHWIKPFWVIDVNDLPEWAGKPYAAVEKERQQQEKEHFLEVTKDEFRNEDNLDVGLNSVVMLLSTFYELFIKDTFYFCGIPIKIHRDYPATWVDESVEFDPNDSTVWLDEVFEEPKEDPNRVRTFFEIYEGSCFSFPYDRRVPPNRLHTFHIPANLNVGLRFYPTENFRYKYKWMPFVVPKPFSLEQGQVLDLGSGEIKIAPRVFVKVVDSAGHAVENVPVEHWLGDVGKLDVDHTDENGVVSFYVRYNRKGKFVVGNKEDAPNLYKALPYEISDEESNGQEFRLDVSDKVLQHIFE